jgi:hypothetical protein
MITFLARLQKSTSKDEIMAILAEAETKRDQRRIKCLQPCSDLQDKKTSESHLGGWSDYLMIPDSGQYERKSLNASLKETHPTENNPSSGPSCESKSKTVSFVPSAINAFSGRKDSNGAQKSGRD